MGAIWRDIRFGVRALLKRDASLTFAVVLILAICIGANTVIFSLVNSIIIRPLPYRDSAKLVVVYEENKKLGLSLPRASVGDFLDWKEQAHTLSEIAAIRFKTFLLTGRTDPEWVTGGAVSSSLFDLLGLKPLHGRPFPSEDVTVNQSNVALVSYSLWQRSFGADPNLIGQTVMLDGESYEVIGIMPPMFDFPQKFDIWVPLTVNAAVPAARRARFLMVIARLKDAVALQQAQSEMDTIASQLEQAYPDTNAGWGVILNSLRDETIGSVGKTLVILLIAVGFVLLIACANVANLLLARAVTREKEMAIRTALGAGKPQLVRQILTESLILSVTGGLVGFLATLWGTPALMTLSPSDLPRLAEVGIDHQVLAFALVLSLLTGLIFGLASAFSTVRASFSSLLKEGGQRASRGLRSHRLLNSLVVFEVAVALVLLIGAGLMIKSLIRLQDVDLGFNSEGLLTIRISLSPSKYQEPTQQRAFYEQLLGQVAAIPGVKNVGAITELPIGGSNSALPIAAEDAPISQDQLMAFNNAISPSYFKVMGIPLIKGRYFDENDRSQKTPITIIDETLAHRFWPEEDPIGKHLITTAGRVTSYEIVGIVKEVKYQGPDLKNSISATYVPYLQVPQPRLVLLVRSVSDLTTLVDQVRRVVRNIDKDQPLSQVKTMGQIVSESVAPKRFYTYLLTLLAFIALVLASLGIYSVLSYSTAQRTHEFGIRMALGAQPRDVLRIVMRDNSLLVLGGVAIGLTGAYALTRFLSALLYEVTTTDASTFILVALMLTIIALLASYLPARTATRVDPVVALRHE